MDSDDKIKQIKEMWNNNYLAAARELCINYLEINPKSVYVWTIYGNVMTQMSEFCEARVALKKAFILCKKNMRYFPGSMIGELYKQIGNYRKAEIWYRYILKAQPLNSNYLVLLGICLIKQGKYDDAKHNFKKALNNSSIPSDEAFYNLALMLRTEQKYDEAIDYLSKALKIDPDYEIAKLAIKDILKAKSIVDKLIGDTH